MNKIVLSVNHLGELAHQTLQKRASGVVSGVASRGIYLQPDHDLTLYLSLDGFKGPLTINLTGLQNDIQPGSPVKFYPSRIEFPHEGFFIHLEEAVIWTPPQPVGDLRHLPGQISTIFELTQRLTTGNEFLPLLEMTLTRDQVSLPGIPGMDLKLRAIVEKLTSGNLDGLVKSLSQLLGLGPGLTPLGDDLILGILLTLNRWGHLLYPGYAFKELNQNLIIKAQQETTRLSASLITCAAAGSADERLILALDSFFSPGQLREEDLQHLLAWGNSSGIAVLAGMLAVVGSFSD
ncbi:MAG: DUF2877 domain-containing protein [Anaerolineales bacterium]|nr:MAG: DUF2877 domain-containing protein [Anaerolineales bacterium]